MTTARSKILVIDDDPAMCALVVDMLKPRGFDVAVGDCKLDVVPQIDAVNAEVVLTDLRLPKVNGIDICRRVVDARPDVPVVVMTGFGSMESAVDAMRADAFDFVTKPVDAAMLAVVLGRAVRHAQLKAEVRRLRDDAQRGGGDDKQPRDGDDGGLVGSSAGIREVREVIRQVADLDVTVLVTGESGTGKEVVARALHRNSKRRSGPFVAINCAAMPEQLLESQLFGHVRGAFTDARSDHQGLFVEASGGTLFLDEIGETPLPLQPKLLRALQERTVRPVGGERDVTFDARIVVATNKDLESAVADGTFREDLYYRVNVVHLALPPLRARGEDALRLAQMFLKQAAARMNRKVLGISASAAQAILAHPWPGNVRELQNAIERAVALTKYDEIVAADLPNPRVPPAHDTVSLLPLEEIEKRHILAVLDSVGFSRKKAATILKIDPKTLYRKLQQWGTDVGQA